MNEAAVLEELTPVAAQLTERHYSSCKPWYPHEYVPWDMGRNFVAGEEWDPDEVPLPEAVRSALFVNLLTEANLPYYFHTIDRMFGNQGAWRELHRHGAGHANERHHSCRGNQVTAADRLPRE